MKIVHIDSSLSGREGNSSMLAQSVVDQLVARPVEQGKQSEVHYRDLNQEGLGHLTNEIFSGFQLAPAERNEIQHAAAQRSAMYIEELREADALVLAVPMYNFAVPSTVKTWIDHVARAGISFAYGENGPVGLLNVKKAYVISTRGGQYAGTEFDHQAPWVEQVLKFLGIQDVECIFAEGMAGGNAEQSLVAANQKIAELA
ncbi:MAG: FMN-dependent NADH-azoreductase [Oleispira sp.]|jgi:FMN-dependent NADH-azoreductase